LHLKRLDLFGFKSFAEKSELDFSAGIAAIVGPNGCGKSNIVDAVRWALGEQSIKTLRGTRMEEVIFSGSENRKPLNFAEVSLTFTDVASDLNLDYDEMTVTRRLFRNGDSEYYINKSPCRLKDITELFMDTGVGKDIYSVIGQGRVDEIINSRPEERREIFEEAAGILKYKMRKKEAGRRLEETRENLVRVQDLIFELDTQLEPLREQAEVTRRYRELKKKIETAEKKLRSFDLISSQEQLARVEKQLQSVRDALFSSAARSGLDEKELQERRLKLQEEQAARKQKENKLSLVSRSLEQKENEKILLGEREERYREQIEQNKQRVKQLELLMKELSSQKEKTEEELVIKKEQLNDLEKERHQIEDHLARLEAGTLPGEVERQQEKIYLIGARRQAALSAVDEVKRQLERMHHQKIALQEEESALQKTLADLEESASTLSAKIEEHSKGLSRNEIKENQLSARIEKKEKKLNSLYEEKRSKREELSGIGSRLSLLEEQDAALSGYYRGVKEVMQARSSIPGILGPVAELISVDEDHLQAVEAALGNGMQYLVAETEKSVHKAIHYLKEKKGGWATFLPLDVIHRAADPLDRFPGWQDLAGVVGRASELVKTEALHRPAVDYLLASTLVCCTLEDASKASRFLKQSCRIVTLDGEVISPGGVIRGGSLPRRNTAGMPLGRRKDIESLNNKQLTVNRELSKINSDINTLDHSLSAEKEQFAEIVSQRQEIATKIEDFQKERASLEREQKAVNDRLQVTSKQYGDYDREESELEERLQNLQREICEADKEVKELENALLGTREQYRQYLEQKNTLEQSKTEVLVKLSSCSEQRDMLENKLEEIKINTGKPADEIKEIGLENDKHEEILFRNLSDQKNIETEINNLTEEKAALIEEVEKRNHRLNELEAEIRDLEEERRRSQNRVDRQEKREKHFSVEQTRLQTELNYQEMRFKELFKTLETVPLEDGFNPDEGRQMVESLKEDLEVLGEVNLGAIEELERLEERINFLKEQKEDLQKGEASLKKVLGEIDRRMEHYFQQAFEQVRENLGETFQELFEGGQVILKLTDPDNILESGIDIVAQPPGKKLQNITLLSAGEKVLTAIALVFAILRFKPAPFYLLDEVESTLDDANLSRFTKFLKQSAERAQFVLITHRKRTMEEAGVLYGVTMPEPGVSRLVSLKLEDN
jgi:chromosome segregation protein